MGFGLAILMWIMWRLQKSCELGFEAIETCYGICAENDSAGT